LLIYSGSGRDVRHVWIAGEHLVRDRQLVRRPFADIRTEYSETYKRFWDRVEEAKKSREVA
jgi:5-methylthioadenosine/S-adenosylhomocysteine deaminase